MKRTVSAIAFVTIVCCSSSTFAQIASIKSVDLIARLTGPGAINNTQTPYQVGGTDLGTMVVHQGRTYFLFGDTFSGDTPAIGGLWRRNTMAYSDDLNPTDGITFNGWITNANNQAKQVFSFSASNDGTITEIPTAAISIGNRIYVWFMAVNWWGPGGIWSISYAGLAFTENLGQSFTKVSNWSLPSWTNFGMVAASSRTDLPAGVDDHLYLWGTPGGRLGGVKLARVDPFQITDLGAYEYFGGIVNDTPTWVTSETLSPAVIPPTVGEMSVMYNAAARRWTALYINDQAPAGCAACGRIEIRQSQTPWGPWSPPLIVATAAAGQYPGLYGSYMNPRYVEQEGLKFYFTMSLWPTYDVYWMRVSVNVKGDMNCDGRMDGLDIQPFVLALLSPSTYANAYPNCNVLNADISGNSIVDNPDLGLFVQCLLDEDCH